MQLTNFFENYSKWLLLLLVATAFVVYSPTLDSKFLGGRDDDANVVENPDIRGLNLENLKKVWTSSYMGMYAPVKMMVHMAEFSVWKINPFGYHLTNIVLHLINICLVFFLIRRMTGYSLAAWLAALLFAIHPMNVETVSWISTRGELMYALFWLLAMLNYFKYVQEDKRKYLYISMALYPLALLNKATAVTFPLVLLVVRAARL